MLRKLNKNAFKKKLIKSRKNEKWQLNFVHRSRTNKQIKTSKSTIKETKDHIKLTNIIVPQAKEAPDLPSVNIICTLSLNLY